MDLLAHAGTAGNAAANLALEEALVRARPAVPLLRIWQNPPCVVIGRAQCAVPEADLAACAAARVPVLRLRPAPADPHPLDSHRSPVRPLSDLVAGLTVPAAGRCWQPPRTGTGRWPGGRRGRQRATGSSGCWSSATAATHGT